MAESKDKDEERSIRGVVRLSKLHGTNETRLSILISDPYQGTGLGSELVSRAVEVAKREHLSHLSAILTDDNQVMQHIFQKLGFSIEPAGTEGLLTARIEL